MGATNTGFSGPFVFLLVAVRRHSQKGFVLAQMFLWQNLCCTKYYDLLFVGLHTSKGLVIFLLGSVYHVMDDIQRHPSRRGNSKWIVREGAI